MQRSRSPARYLAPIALLAAIALLIAVVSGSMEGGADPAPQEPAAQADGGERTGDGGGEGEPETYEVQDGDTLEAISEETGVSVEQLLRLNPELDPQSLIAGQELRLTE